jgi:DNA-binding response OmpR family regulator
MKISIAEDDKDTASSYKMALEERNHQVVITDNGEDCLKFILSNYVTYLLKQTVPTFFISRLMLSF